jgi:hypothetical protein
MTRCTFVLQHYVSALALHVDGVPQTVRTHRAAVWRRQHSIRFRYPKLPLVALWI